jgi:hypothetical protein
LPPDPEDLFAEMRAAVQGQNFATRAEAEAFIEKFMRQQNEGAQDDFHGLSPEQMHRLLNYPFSSPPLAQFAEPLAIDPTAPILTLFNLMAEAIDDKGLKATAKGNLPRKFCREAAQSYWGEEGYRENTRFAGINMEMDFGELYVARGVAELAGLVRKYKGRFILSRDCRKLVAGAGDRAIYPRLFRSYVEKYNWAYRDRYPDLRIIQTGFLFTLYLLSLYGSEWRPQGYYADRFMKAFPMVLHEVTGHPLFPPEKSFASCYALRALERCGEFLGLALLDPVMADEPFPKRYRVKKQPLLDEFVQFHVTHIS